MAFGQQSGPPASARQLQQLLALLLDAGHDGFRDARGPLGFSQRQAAGKFTVEEATAFIDQLEEAQHAGEGAPRAEPAERLTTAERALRKVPAHQLAAELQRRGWIVVEP